MPKADRSRLRTAEAMIALSVARLLVATTSFRHWRNTLGSAAAGRASDELATEAGQLARHVERAGKLLPFLTKCLPRAMALSWMLRRRGIGHTVVFAVRPADHRGSDEDLHAWVEIAGETILGELPGPWVETLRLGHSEAPTN